MGYFNYHAKAKNLIKTGHLVAFDLVETYKNISPALILYFDQEKPMPIRPHKIQEYLDLIDNTLEKV